MIGTKDEKSKILKTSKEILSKVSGVLENTKAISELMEKFDKQMSNLPSFLCKLSTT